MRLLLPTLLALIATTPLARAASFDCARAATTVEHAICADAKLSALDEREVAAYAAATTTLGIGDTPDFRDPVADLLLRGHQDWTGRTRPLRRHHQLPARPIPPPPRSPRRQTRPPRSDPARPPDRPIRHQHPARTRTRHHARRRHRRPGPHRRRLRRSCLQLQRHRPPQRTRTPPGHPHRLRHQQTRRSCRPAHPDRARPRRRRARCGFCWTAWRPHASCA